MKLRMWIGNLDGQRTGLVISTSKERARKVVNTSRAHFDDYWALQRDVWPDFDADTLYTHSSRYTGPAPAWVKGRCPLA